MTKSKELSPRRERFCQEYAVDCNGTQAAIRAGYSENGAAVTAHHLLRKTKIKERIVILQDQIAKTIGLTAEYVILGFMEVYERCMQKVAVTNDYGSPTGYTFNAAGANKALEMLGKYKRLWDDRAADDTPKQTIEIIFSAGKDGKGNGDPLAHRLTGVNSIGGLN